MDLRGTRHQGKEGSDGRNVAHEERLRYLAKCLPHIGLMPCMGDEMKGIVDGDADDDTRYAYHYHRHAVVHQCHASQGKEPSPSYGKGNEQDVPEAAEGIEQEQEDEDGCQGNGQDAVAYNLVCIPNGNLRSACHVCLDGPTPTLP